MLRQRRLRGGDMRPLRHCLVMIVIIVMMVSIFLSNHQDNGPITCLGLARSARLSASEARTASHALMPLYAETAIELTILTS